MIGKINKKLFIFFILLFAHQLKAQVNTAFLKHLSENKLMQEQLTYISENSSTSDSLHLLKAKYYLQYFNDTLFLHHYNQSKKLLETDTSAILLAHIQFLHPKSKLQQQWFTNRLATYESVRCKQVLEVYNFSLHPRKEQLALLPEKLRSDFSLYLKANQKKPALAALLSTLVPGSGQLYIGRNKSFFTTLISHVGWGVQSYESIKHLGIKHPLSIINLCTLGIFYLSNIYGSYKDTHSSVHETKYQFLYNASNYYYYDYPCPLF